MIRHLDCRTEYYKAFIEKDRILYLERRTEYYKVYREAERMLKGI